MSDRISRIVRVGVQVVLRQSDEILLVQRNRGFGKGSWCLPGGHLEPNETIVECGIRELLEETGVVGKDPRVIGVTDPLDKANDHMQVIIEVTEWSGFPVVMDLEECRAVEFFPLAALPEPIFVASSQVLEKVKRAAFY